METASAFSWEDHAACRGTGLSLFFGPDGEREPERLDRETQARAICADCPVRTECLEFAIALPVRYGTWGGLSEDERAAERRRRQRAAKKAAA